MTHEILSGVVTSYNISPRGGIEGMLLSRDEDGETVQVNFPPDTGIPLAAIGQAVTIAVDPEPHHGPHHHEGEHPVYHVVGGATEPEDGEPTTLEGAVKSLNYARHGEVNGVVLDGGEFVHLKPDGVKRVGLKIGDRIEVVGKARPMMAGGRVVEASVVNGTKVGGKKH
ncbi:hypothetical protein FRUB_04019 [Fimbriiglobus ruber]|uniref:Uncharacterized protein n=1 Tax=Fimbriiglobus ruber TaxID=1908690 RepID=A0A225DKI0_9BACT|nr:hypothetical protein FRUB_04019 [Fimbriiglobus ruber]